MWHIQTQGKVFSFLFIYFFLFWCQIYFEIVWHYLTGQIQLLGIDSPRKECTFYNGLYFHSCYRAWPLISEQTSFVPINVPLDTMQTSALFPSQPKSAIFVAELLRCPAVYLPYLHGSRTQFTSHIGKLYMYLYKILVLNLFIVGFNYFMSPMVYPIFFS